MPKSSVFGFCMYFSVYFVMMNNNLYIYCLIYTHTHTHTHIYIYIYIYFGQTLPLHTRVQGEYRNTINNSSAHLHLKVYRSFP